MITYTLPIAGNLPVKTEVIANEYECAHTVCVCVYSPQHLRDEREKGGGGGGLGGGIENREIIVLSGLYRNSSIKNKVR